MPIGVPVKVLYEAEGHIVTCETKTGQTYRGKLIQTEDNMNLLLSSVTATSKNGKVRQLESVYIRGSNIYFIILPDMVNSAPIFKPVPKKPTAGRGKSAILGAQAALRGQGRGRGRGHRGGCQGASGASKH